MTTQSYQEFRACAYATCNRVTSGTGVEVGIGAAGEIGARRGCGEVGARLLEGRARPASPQSSVDHRRKPTVPAPLVPRPAHRRAPRWCRPARRRRRRASTPWWRSFSRRRVRRGIAHDLATGRNSRKPLPLAVDSVPGTTEAPPAAEQHQRVRDHDDDQRDLRRLRSRLRRPAPVISSVSISAATMTVNTARKISTSRFDTVHWLIGM